MTEGRRSPKQVLEEADDPDANNLRLQEQRALMEQMIDAPPNGASRWAVPPLWPPVSALGKPGTSREQP